MNLQNEIQTMPQIRMLRLPEVIRKTALSRSQIYRLIGMGVFPKQIHLGERTAGWVEQEIEEWLMQRITNSRKSGASS